MMSFLTVSADNLFCLYCDLGNECLSSQRIACICDEYGCVDDECMLCPTVKGYGLECVGGGYTSCVCVEDERCYALIEQQPLLGEEQQQPLPEEDPRVSIGASDVDPKMSIGSSDSIQITMSEEDSNNLRDIRKFTGALLWLFVICAAAIVCWVIFKPLIKLIIGG